MRHPIGKGYLTKSLKTADKQEALALADDWYRDIKYKLKNNIAINTRKFTYISKLYLEKLESNVKLGIIPERRLKDYRPLLDIYINPFFAKHNIDSITQQDIEAFKNHCLVYWIKGEGFKEKEHIRQANGKSIENPAKKPRAELSNSSMNKICVVLRAIFKVAVQQKAINQADVPKISKLVDGQKQKSKHDSRRPAFSKAEYDKLVHHLKNWHLETEDKEQIERRLLLNDYVLILANTGIRPGTESDGLRWKDIQTVTQDGNSYIQLNIDGKTGKRQPIAMDRTKKYLERIKKRRTDFLGHAPNKNEHVFSLPDGTPVKNDYFRAAFKRALIAFGLLEDSYGKNRSPYSLRHTYATLRLAKGVGLEELSKNMGTSYKMIQDHYSHTTPLLMSKSLTRV